MHYDNSYIFSGKWSRRISAILPGIPAIGFILLAAVALLEPSPAFPAEEQVLLREDTFSGESGWQRESRRAEISPEFFVAERPSLGGPGSLGMYGASNSVVRGSWSKVVKGIGGGGHYRFEAAFLAQGVDFTHQTVFAALEWRDADGAMIGHQRDYAAELDLANGWQKVGGTFQAPSNAGMVKISLYLSHCAQARVWWDAISLVRVPDPPKRHVRLATVNCRPHDNSASTQSVEDFCKVVEEAGKQGSDIVCLGEGINLCGVVIKEANRPAEYGDIAEPIPGPTTRRLGELARKYKMYIVAALGEREKQALYNTAVLIDRNGEIAGKYRKVYIPEGEYDQGCAQGDAYPVFDTDFGRIGMMICWDSWFADPARALSVQGAEVILLPIWGGNSTLIRGRAIENHVYVVSCGYDVESTIYDPWGTLLAEAKERPGVAVADIDLNYPPACPWPWPLGDTRQVLLQARRNDIKLPALER
ncbi:MAG: hypothetical protein A3F83_08265 [Candidatus Glassbacteria bacterium RIFCSPLOWO2_12_FULL_58_11]|uniref:CN hydrolase domain-containing protein n=1 Tax=Candidatus Glassbacteria bacterium RIFCSPLOWO2_12_FULL_58_11 TaxID=1817867 RepID=A0A1F5YWU3_9BACT|nr:MAG: hypothetical protein A3F83_08265 [Candidatus Glassbacteria bacterium RIFCSPLOWO2_12_FULL_58_11]